MKVKTNVRAGKQNRGGSYDDTPQVEDPVLPPPPVSRCVGV
jgi:hypothetical protein